MKISAEKVIAVLLVIIMSAVMFSSCKEKDDKTVTSNETLKKETVSVNSETVSTVKSDESSDNITSFVSQTSETETVEVTNNMFEGKTPVLTNGSYVVKDLSYGSRVDMSSAAEKASSQIFDIYLPALPGSINKNAKVFLYIHGGSWSDVNYTKDNDNIWLCNELAASGMIVFSMNYVLAGSRNSGDSVDDMIKDIDAMLSHAKKLLAELSVNTTACGIGGTSAGGHLSSLYAYRYGNKAPLRIAYEVDVVGPVDLMLYKPLIDSYIKLSGSFSAFTGYEISGFSFSKIFGSMAGIKNVTEENLPKLWDKMNELSSVNYITKNSCPTILMYGLRDHQLTDIIPSDMKGDGLVPISNYESLTEKLKANGVPYIGKVFEGYSHGDLPWKSPANDWIKEQIRIYSDIYAK